jgi:hypothetical protein
VGYDFSAEAIAAARRETASDGLTNLVFQEADVATLTIDNQLDIAFAFDSIHDQAHPDRMLANIFQALKPGGIFLVQEIQGHSHVHHNQDHPMAPFVYTVSCMHCMSVSLSQDGMGLGAAWGQEKAQEMLTAAGFRRHPDSCTGWRFAKRLLRGTETEVTHQGTQCGACETVDGKGNAAIRRFVQASLGESVISNLTQRQISRPSQPSLRCAATHSGFPMPQPASAGKKWRDVRTGVICGFVPFAGLFEEGQDEGNGLRC